MIGQQQPLVAPKEKQRRKFGSGRTAAEPPATRERL